MSAFKIEVLYLCDSKRVPSEAAVIPFPRPEITPPETNINFGFFIVGMSDYTSFGVLKARFLKILSLDFTVLA